MSTQNTAPDFGEPWQSETGDFEIYSKSEHNATAYAESARIRDRIIKCVNACAGMQDPAAEIQALRAELQKTRKILADANRGAERNSHINNSLAGKLNAARDENEAMRAAIRDASKDLECVRCLESTDTILKREALAKLQPFLP